MSTIDPTRRRLLFALQGGAVLASPLALLACGGSSGSGDTATTAGGPTPGPLAANTLSVPIELPAAVAAGALQVIGATGTSAVVGNAASVAVVDGGPQLVGVVGADGAVLALGWAGSAAQGAVSPRSTAAVLLHFALGLPFLGATARDTLRERLFAEPAVAAFGDRIAAALAADRRALTGSSDALVAALQDAVTALQPATAQAASARRHAQGLVVEPATDASGLQVVQGDALNTFTIDNIYVRRAVVFVNREAYVASGATTETPLPGAPEQVGEALMVPLPAAVDSVANVINGWANQYWSADDTNGFYRSVSDPVTLEVTPADAKRTRYSVVVLMPGALPPQDAAAFARLPDTQKAWVTGLDLDKNLYLQLLLEDLLGPVFFELLSSRIGRVDKNAPLAQQADKAVLKQLAVTLLGVLKSRVPEVLQRLDAGSLDAWGAFKVIMKACTVDPDTGEVSPLLSEFLQQTAQVAASQLADLQLRSRMLEIATGVNLGNRNVLGFLPVLKILGEFDKWMGRLALGRIALDAGRSQRMVSWSVTATKAKVALRPDPFEVDATGVTYAITADIVDNDNDEYGIEKGSFDFDWVCTGLYGDLYSPADSALANPNQFTTSKNNATVNYLPKHPEPEQSAPETITVKAYFRPIVASQPRQYLGSATTTVKFKKAFSVALSPGGTLDVPTGIDLPVSAFVKEKLPDGATVEWTWTHGGIGTLAADPADADPATSTARLSTGDADGAARVQIVARVNVPGTTVAVVTDPVEAVFNVKKGTRTVTFEASGGVFACGPGCGVTDYTAFIVPRLPKAISYEAVFSGFGYANCNRSLTWSAPVPDGGDCYFPVTYHPVQQGSNASFWAVWMGFGTPLEAGGRCTVTITLPA